MSANPSMHFDGVTFQLDRDGRRLAMQQNRIRALMRDGAWRTLSQISQATDDPEASVSARLRDLRKPRFGSNTVERRFVSRGLFEYRLIVNPQQLELVS